MLLLIVSVARLSPAVSAQTRSAPTHAPQASNPLQALVQEALTHSPLIAAARRHWQAQTKTPIQARTLPDPQIDLQHFTVGSPRPLSGYETSDFYYTGFGISQDVPGPGKLRLRGEQATQDAESSRQVYEAERRQVVEQVRESYFNLFFLTKALGLLGRTHAELERIERVTGSQYQVGMAQQQDVLKAQLEMTALLKEIETDREELEQAQADLKALLGRDPGSLDVAVGDVAPSHPQWSEEQVRERALAGSPVLKEREALDARSDVDLKLARRDYIPDLTVAYMYQKTGPGFRDYYMLTLGARIPLYFWRKQTPALEQASLEKTSAHLQTDATRLAVASAAQNQWIATQTTERVLTLYRDGLIPQAEATEKSAMASYSVAKVDFQTLLTAVIDVLRLRQEYFRTLADHEIAIAKIEQIVGETL